MTTSMVFKKIWSAALFAFPLVRKQKERKEFFILQVENIYPSVKVPVPLLFEEETDIIS